MRLIRPLLGVSRQEVRAYLSNLGQVWREDASNLDLARTRARIRHDLLPKLADDYNPAVADALIRLSQVAAEASIMVDRRAWRDLRRLTVSRNESSLTLDRAGLARLDSSRRVALVRHAWQRLGWPRGGDDSRPLVATGPVRSANPDRAGSRSPTESRPSSPMTAGPSAAPTGNPFPCSPRNRWSSPARSRGGKGRVISSLDPSGSMDEWVDFAAIQGPLLVRAAQPGDRFDPLGLVGQSQPLADFFRGRRVARADRPFVPLVTDRLGIVWVAGHRISHRVRRTEATTKLLGVAV